MGLTVLASLIVLVCSASTVAAQTAEQSYRAKCSACHDGGAGQAPRIDDRAAWSARAARGRASLYEVAVRGKPDTAMAAKGGYPELSDADTRAIVDYMLNLTGNPDTPMHPVTSGVATARAGDVPMAGSGQAPTSDADLSVRIAERLRAALGKPDNRIETYEGVVTLRGVGIKVETREGVATLSGSVHDSEHIRRAGEIAAKMPGVKQVVNRVISAGMLEWD